MPTTPTPATDLRVARSRAQLHQALLDLLRSGDASVTISTVCRRAGVSRPTFYQHFDSLDDLLASALGDHHLGIGAVIDPDDAQGSSRELTRRVARAITEDADLYRALIGSGATYPQARLALERLLQARLREHVAATMPDLLDAPTADLTLAYAAGGFIAATGSWLDAHPDAANMPVGERDALADHLWSLVHTAFTG